MSVQPGRDLDALVAEKVMGWRRSLGTFGGTHEWQPEGVMLVPGDDAHGRPHRCTTAAVTYRENVPRYSTDIAAAWEVVGKLTEGAGTVIKVSVTKAGAMAIYYPQTTAPTEVDLRYGPQPVSVHATTAPHAICLAALEAMSA